MAEVIDIASARPTQTELPDAAQRAQALDIRHSWIVEAPAGSGKTGLLIQRFLKLLADESVTAPEQVLAITFTRKATAEMRERVLAQLQAAASEDSPGNAFDRETRPLALAALDRDRALGWALLSQPNRLRIRTIDSVCSEIANSLPVLSGNGGRRDVVEDAGSLYALAAHRTFMQLGGPDAVLNHALREVLLHRDGNLADCERRLAEMLRLRDQWGQLFPLGRSELDDALLDATVLPKLERALDNAICSALTKTTRHFPEPLLRELTTAAASMADIPGYKGSSSPIAICVNRTVSPRERAEDLDHWRALIHLIRTASSGTWRRGFNKLQLGFEHSTAEKKRIEELVQQFHGRDDLLDALNKLDALPPAKYPPDQWAMAKLLFRILNRAMAELQLVFAERSECDYAEIALAARTALTADEGPHDLEAALGLRLQHILVDEMQDTSSSQYELIQMLTAHFDGHSQTAFLVGDPKQSIYLFRQARVERFLRTMSTERLGDVPIGLLQLTANFRSQAGLVDHFNDDFSKILPVLTGSPGDVHYVHAFATRPFDLAVGSRVWHPDVLPYVPKGTPTNASAIQQRKSALEVREIIEHWRAKPLPKGRSSPWKIAVLVRARTHLETIVAALKGDLNLNCRDSQSEVRHSERSEESPHFAATSSIPYPETLIPYRAVDIDPLTERPEVQDLFALTRALLHPADRIAWLAVLHAPWCGFGLAELHTLTGADDPAFAGRAMQSLIAERGDLLPPAAIQRLERIWPVLEAATGLRSRAPLAQTVERTWRSLGGDAYCSPTELANAHSYLQLLETVEQEQRGVSIPAVESRLDRLFAAASADPDAVELLTIHKAKGLEWDVVIVPALERTTGSNRTQLLSWVELDTPTIASGEDEAAHFVLAPITGKGEDSTQLHTWICGIHKARQEAEDKRLFYVACTRAKEELHLFAAPQLSAKGELKPRPGSLLEAAWPAAESAFAGPLASAASPSNVTEFPAPPADEDAPLDLAASAAQQPPERPAVLKRLPLAFDPASRLANPKPLPYGTSDEAPSLHLERPEGSVAARAFGNAVHAFLEKITQQIATGDSPSNVTAEIPAWTLRIAAVLRSEGLPPIMVERLTQRVLHALDSTLKDPMGLWLLSPHANAATEYALTAWSAQRSNVRIDRTFRAGPGPLTPGAGHLWIVDYKTTTHGPEGLEAFLAEERARYAPQLEAYAAVFRKTGDEPTVRLALYYPMLSKLIWWQP